MDIWYYITKAIDHYIALKGTGYQITAHDLKIIIERAHEMQADDDKDLHEFRSNSDMH